MVKIQNSCPPYFLNVGELSEAWLSKNKGFPTADRKWECSIVNSFISAGQAPKWSNQLKKLKIGDIVIAFVTGRGYVGIGEIDTEITHIKKFNFLVDPLQFNTNIFLNAETLDKAEYVVGVQWFEGKIQPKEKAFWEKRIGLFGKQHIVASLANQQSTIEFIESKFEVEFSLK